MYNNFCHAKIHRASYSPLFICDAKIVLERNIWQKALDKALCNDFLKKQTNKQKNPTQQKFLLHARDNRCIWPVLTLMSSLFSLIVLFWSLIICIIGNRSKTW